MLVTRQGDGDSPHPADVTHSLPVAVVLLRQDGVKVTVAVTGHAPTVAVVTDANGHFRSVDHVTRRTAKGDSVFLLVDAVFQNGVL